MRFMHGDLNGDLPRVRQAKTFWVGNGPERGGGPAYGGSSHSSKLSLFNLENLIARCDAGFVLLQLLAAVSEH
jgi:hypothetical protein